MCTRPRKGTSLGGTACFGVLCVKIRPGPLAVVARTAPLQKITRFWCAKSRMCRNDTPGRIVTNVCTDVGVHDVITCADLYNYRLRGLGVAGGKSWASPLTCVVALTTCVIGTCCESLASTELSFHLCNVLRDCPRGVPRETKMW